MPDHAATARIRHMTANDVEQVAALIHTSWVSTYGPLMGEAKAEQESAKKHQPATIAADMKRMHSESFVGEEATGRIVGYAYAKVTKGVLWLDRLHVAPDHQGTGLAAGLLHAVIVNYIGEGSISLEVIKGNDRAIRFYEREGFMVTDERDACGGIGGVPTLIMRKAISRA
ncbi:MAG: GNAT family N-acetyltransferase [Pseudomonadota bacterium]